MPAKFGRKPPKPELGEARLKCKRCHGGFVSFSKGAVMANCDECKRTWGRVR